MNNFLYGTGLKKAAKTAYLYSFITACLFIGICSKSSPLYPFNDWVDANCFMTVGKSMLHGLMPYKDLIDLYIINTFLVNMF